MSFETDIKVLYYCYNGTLSSLDSRSDKIGNSKIYCV